ncbi:hypothetical protein M2322_004626 [Rhodoblastus acidophilus]|uniref:hypothetical protein n=1 Tax=Rhodoblastus acidophilus TaxID=1074 RepID=UPI0022246D40|nr:hypothetical protein [Rhodoblastus acidophilus]MCW2319057.1 hypothetical protein [Rhodoblastus acidophilus]
MSFKHVVEPAKLGAARVAGQAAARYLHLDPAYWIERAALAGVRFELVRSGFVTNCLEADFETAVFLEGWMDATPGAMDAVTALLRRRTSMPH